MGAYRDLYTDMELDRLREENELLRLQVEALEQMAEQYLAALLTRAMKEPVSEVLQ